jgi:hypothetical protein
MVDRMPRLWSYHYPEQLLIASTFEEQAELLADGCWRASTLSPPTPPRSDWWTARSAGAALTRKPRVAPFLRALGATQMRVRCEHG